MSGPSSRSRTALREALRSRRRLFGGWVSLGHPSITEIFAQAGLDFIGIDLEHSTIDLAQSQRIIAAAQAAGVPCLPRIASHDGEQIRRLADSGADGIIVPSVSTRTQVDRIVEWCKYPPVGKRSYGVSRAQGYGFDFDTYAATWNASSSLIIQIESIEAVDVSDRLLEAPEVDGAMIGPYDLSGSLGMPGKLSHPRVTEACARVVDACRKVGKACGTQIVEPGPAAVDAAFDTGYTFVVLASDVFALWKWSESVRTLITKLRSDGPA